MVFAIHWHESATGGHVAPSWAPLPPPSPSHPSGSSQCTSFECPVSRIELGLVIYFTCGNIHVSTLFSQIIPPSPSLDCILETVFLCFYLLCADPFTPCAVTCTALLPDFSNFTSSRELHASHTGVPAIYYIFPFLRLFLHLELFSSYLLVKVHPFLHCIFFHNTLQGLSISRAQTLGNIVCQLYLWSVMCVYICRHWLDWKLLEGAWGRERVYVQQSANSRCAKCPLCSLWIPL